MSSTLHDYTDVEPIAVREMKQIRPHDIVVGWAGPSNREENVAVSHRHRHPYDDGKSQDYFRKCGGYTYDSRTLNAMKQIGVERIAILEVDNDRILEFDRIQFENSDLNSETVASLFARTDGGEVNYCVPVEDALYSWDVEDCTIMKDHQ